MLFFIKLSYLLVGTLILGTNHVVATVLPYRAENTDTHLIRFAEQLQALLMLWADLTI